MLAFVMVLGYGPVNVQAAQVNAAPLTRDSAAKDGMVRVLLSSMKYPDTLDVTVSGSYTADGNARVTLSNGDQVRIRFNSSNGQMTMTVNGQTYDMGREMNLRRHQTGGQSGLHIEQSKMPDNLYPGDLQLIAQRSGSIYRMYPIIHVYIEYYLHGVVPYEMGNSAHLEALKAQAVAARTYTLNKMNVRASSLYDVVDTTNDQVYYGNSDTTTRCTQAVNETKGIVLMNGNSLTGTFYTASNGGQTESAANLWGSDGYDYLTVKDDPFDLMNAASVHRKITVYADNSHPNQNATLKVLLQTKLENILRNYGYSTSGVQVLSIDAVTPHTPKYDAPSRLYTKLDFEVTASTAGGSVDATLTFDIFKELESSMGMKINTSDNELWSVVTNDDTYVISSRRFGHGIGMSQRGAMQMGALGYTYDQILGFYYEDCRRVQYTFTHTILSPVESGGTETIVTTEKPAEIISSSGATAIVKLVGVSDKLAVRNAASAGGTILTSIVNGGLVNVLAQMDDWTMIQLGSIVGYVPSSALQFYGDVPLATEQTPTQITQWAVVKCSGTLNLRTSGSMTSSVVTSMPSGAILCVFTQSDGWAHVQYGALTGWCSTDFLQMSSSYPGTVTEELSGQGSVSIPSGSGTVNLRETPSTSARVLATLSNGTQITVTSSDGSWCSVIAADGTEGYIMAAYVSYGDDNVDSPSGDDNVTDSPEDDTGILEAIVHTASTSLNLRQQPNTHSAVLAALPRGESVVVTGRGASWSAVRYGNLSGYVMTQYLRFPSDEETEEEVICQAVVDTASDSLNMRQKPVLGSTVLLQIPKGTKISVLHDLDGWCKITYAGINGYVMRSYLTFEDTPIGSKGQYALVKTASGNLNLRQSPAETALVLRTIPSGTSVQVITRGSEWSKISHDGVRGYVMTSFLDFTGSSTETIGSGSQVKVHTDNGGLNLRETASATAQVLLIIPDGTVLECLSYGSDWTRVRYGENTGYVMTRFLNTVSGAQNNPQTITSESGASSGTVWVYTGGGGLNLRQSASTQAEVLISIPDGTAVTLITRGNDWSQVQYQGMNGYVMTQYLSDQQSGSSSYGKTGWIASTVTGGVNLRFMPDTSGRVLAVLPPGAQISVTLDGEIWSVVRYGDQVGYVMSRYITYDSAETSVSDNLQEVYDTSMYVISGWEAEVTPESGNVNLRAWCSTDAPVRIAMPKGAVVRLTEYGDEWCHVVYGEVEGYCMTKFLSPREMQ